MRYYASKTHNSLNGVEYQPELIAHLCVNPYYPVKVSNNALFMIDSGAFQDVGTDSRISFPQALKRQLSFEKKITDNSRPAHAIVSYDRLVDEQHTGTTQIKKRVDFSESQEYIEETIKASEYLAGLRSRLAPRKLILSCQGTTTDQYLFCLSQVLNVAQPGDIIGFGGFCIISKSKEYEKQFYEVIEKAFPLIAGKGIRQVHIFGVGIIKVLVQAEMLANYYGIDCSYDTSSYEVNAVMGRVFNPYTYKITGTFDKSQKKTGYVPAKLALFNVKTVCDFWSNMSLINPFGGGLAVHDDYDYKANVEQKTPQVTMDRWFF